MKFKISRARLGMFEEIDAGKPCDRAFKENENWVIEIASLDELIMLQDKVKHPIILFPDKDMKQLIIDDDLGF